MKKFFVLLSIVGLLTFAMSNQVIAQEETETDATEQADTSAVDTTAVAETPAETVVEEDEVVEDKTFHQVLKEKFIEGGAGFMGIVLIALILGLALAIERILYLNLATTNTKKLLGQLEDALSNGGINEAKELCKDTRGPVAAIFFQGLDRYEEGLDNVEKSLIAYGSVQMGRLESGLSWISLFIALAPMLGFMGTVIGMISAFDAIEAQGDISPTIVAGGIKIALLTTVFGLIVAVILQLFYNYIVSKIDKLVNDMEDATISFMDILTGYNKMSK
jgi:biopolymer transport protein ExbB